MLMYETKCKIEVSTEMDHGNLIAYEIRYRLLLKGTEISLRTLFLSRARRVRVGPSELTKITSGSKYSCRTGRCFDSLWRGIYPVLKVSRFIFERIFMTDSKRTDLRADIELTARHLSDFSQTLKEYP